MGSVSGGYRDGMTEMDAPRLSELHEHRGPFLSVYADVTRDAADGARAVEIRWKSHEARLRGQGAPEELVKRVCERVVEQTGRDGSTGRFIVATEQDGVLRDEIVPCCPRYEVATWSPLPDTMAWLADRETLGSALLAPVDRSSDELLEEFEAARGRGGVAVGIHDTLAGAVRGQVDTLLLDPGAAMLVHVRPGEVEGLDLSQGVGPLDRGVAHRGDQLAIAAAAQSSADVRVVRQGALTSDGVAALLRRDT